MKKYIYTVGAAALALAMSGLPAFALAETNSTEGQGEASAQVRVQALGTGVRASTTAEVNGEQQEQTAEATREQAKQNAEVTREQQKQELERTGSTTEASSTRPSIKGGDDDQEIDLELEDDGDFATSNDDLNQKIEVRRHELDDEKASSTPRFKDAMKNANEVRLAVHALLASKDLIGGIGQQVSEIAKSVNDSVASTTNAEAKIQSRGFLSRLFFGGDKTSAEVIAQEAAKNQARIDSLTALLGQANISADVQVTLSAQITALQTAQARLQTLAEKEKTAWGLFSWRF